MFGFAALPLMRKVHSVLVLNCQTGPPSPLSSSFEINEAILATADLSTITSLLDMHAKAGYCAVEVTLKTSQGLLQRQLSFAKVSWAL